MAELLLKNLDDSLILRLQENAEQHGVTLEDEAVSVLKEAIKPESRKDIIVKMREIRERNAHLQKTNTLDLLHEGRNER